MPIFKIYHHFKGNFEQNSNLLSVLFFGPGRAALYRASSGWLSGAVSVSIHSAVLCPGMNCHSYLMGWRSLFSSPSYGLFSRRRGVIMAPNYRRRLYFFLVQKVWCLHAMSGTISYRRRRHKSVVAIFWDQASPPQSFVATQKNYIWSWLLILSVGVVSRQWSTAP